MKKIKYLILVILLVIVGSCNSDKKTDKINGVWESIGYGRLVKVDDGEFLIADITEISCLPVMSGKVSDFGENISVKNDTLLIKDGINTYYFTKLKDAPEVCKNQASDEKKKDPIYNFEVLANNFKDHYAYFELRNVNWDEMYTKYRAKVTSKTTLVELYTIMNTMLNEFNDGHISLSVPDEIEEEAKKNAIANKPISEKPKTKRYTRKDLSTAVAKKYIPEGSSRNRDLIRWGFLENNIGYLQINQMMGFANYGVDKTLSRREYWTKYFAKAEESLDHTKDEVEGFTPLINEAFNELKNTDALIIDIRFNGGGSDAIGLKTLSLFNKTEKLAFTKKARHLNGFTKTVKVNLKATENAYQKPVYLLIGNGSASATEIMTLASLELGNFTRIGGNTNGVFSDILDKSLPNGWNFGLSNEVYLDLSNNNYEGVGITPDFNMNYPKKRQNQFAFIMESLTKKDDKAINKAISLINKK